MTDAVLDDQDGGIVTPPTLLQRSAAAQAIAHATEEHREALARTGRS
ncbi:hypothetical protein [Methylobacterium terricola]|nr:hypothetical protein [Methylobacterium terricola]